MWCPCISKFLVTHHRRASAPSPSQQTSQKVHTTVAAPSGVIANSLSSQKGQSSFDNEEVSPILPGEIVNERRAEIHPRDSKNTFLVGSDTALIILPPHFHQPV